MKCARLHLQQRGANGGRRARPTTGAAPAARRYCQRRLVDPGLDEDPRWTGPLQERFRCNIEYQETEIYDLPPEGQGDNADELYLTVQTLQFRGERQEQRRPRACFQYKALGEGAGQQRHRMFVKTAVPAADTDDDCSSQHSACYFDDYVDYILNAERSRPPSEAGHYLSAKSDTAKINKAIQVDPKNVENTIQNKHATKTKKSTNVTSKGDKTNSEETKNEVDDGIMQDAKVTYHKSGKRKSITISRAQSPETVQVIRVDVVCNYSSCNSVISEEDSKRDTQGTIEKETDTKLALKDLRNSHFANRYFLTKSIKPLDASVAGGAKVTLLCKTFKLADRTRAGSRDSNANKEHRKLCNSNNISVS